MEKYENIAEIYFAQCAYNPYFALKMGLENCIILGKLFDDPETLKEDFRHEYFKEGIDILKNNGEIWFKIDTEWLEQTTGVPKEKIPKILRKLKKIGYIKLKNMEWYKLTDEKTMKELNYSFYDKDDFKS